MKCSAIGLRSIALAQVAICVLIIGVLAAASILNISGNASPSEPRGLYRLTHQPLRRGALVVLKLPIKQIAGLPGDIVRVTAKGSYVNGRLWPHSGIPAGAAAHFPFGTYVLQPGQLWVLGHHPLSYDSRYFGMIPESLVKATAQPLFTTEQTK